MPPCSQDDVARLMRALADQHPGGSDLVRELVELWEGDLAEQDRAESPSASWGVLSAPSTPPSPDDREDEPTRAEAMAPLVIFKAPPPTLAPPPEWPRASPQAPPMVHWKAPPAPPAAPTGPRRSAARDAQGSSAQAPPVGRRPASQRALPVYCVTSAPPGQEVHLGIWTCQWATLCAALGITRLPGSGYHCNRFPDHAGAEAYWVAEGWDGPAPRYPPPQ